MGSEFFHTVEAIVALVVTVALVSVIVSKNAQTPAVVQSLGSALGNNLAVAEAPVTGANAAPILSYPSENPWQSSPYMG